MFHILNILRKHENKFAFWNISQHWDTTGNWKLPCIRQAPLFFILHSHQYGCCCPDNVRSQGISINGIHLYCMEESGLSTKRVNSLWNSDAIWWHRLETTLAQVMPCCLKTPPHYLNQCWFLISQVLLCDIHLREQFHSHGSSFKNCNVTVISPRVQWVKPPGEPSLRPTRPLEDLPTTLSLRSLIRQGSLWC